MSGHLILLLYGLIVGISLGLTGGGGSIITVPLLVYLVGQSVHSAIPTSLVIVGGTAFAGYLSRLSSADTRSGLVLGLIGLFGAVPGRLASQYFSGQTLLLLFALIMLVASYFMFRSKTYALDDADRVSPNWVAVAVAGVGLGFLTGFLGVGGGFLIVPCLVLILHLPMRQAIPTSLLVIAINCASALIAPALSGAAGRAIVSVDWSVAAFFLVGGLFGSWIGGAAAAKLDQRALRRVFAVFIFTVGLFITVSATGLVPVKVK